MRIVLYHSAAAVATAGMCTGPVASPHSLCTQTCSAAVSCHLDGATECTVCLLHVGSHASWSRSTKGWVQSGVVLTGRWRVALFMCTAKVPASGSVYVRSRLFLPALVERPWVRECSIKVVCRLVPDIMGKAGSQSGGVLRVLQQPLVTCCCDLGHAWPAAMVPARITCQGLRRQQASQALCDTAAITVW